MSKRFKIGDHVIWNSEAGQVSGQIIKVDMQDTDYKGHKHHATEVWAADSDMTERPLTFRLVAECDTKADCEMQAESRAKKRDENGFDSLRDAWWGKSANLLSTTTTRPPAGQGVSGTDKVEI